MIGVFLTTAHTSTPLLWVLLQFGWSATAVLSKFVDQTIKVLVNTPALMVPLLDQHNHTTLLKIDHAVTLIACT